MMQSSVLGGEPSNIRYMGGCEKESSLFPSFATASEYL